MENETHWKIETRLGVEVFINDGNLISIKQVPFNDETAYIVLDAHQARIVAQWLVEAATELETGME